MVEEEEEEDEGEKGGGEGMVITGSRAVRGLDL